MLSFAELNIVKCSSRAVDWYLLQTVSYFYNEDQSTAQQGQNSKVDLFLDPILVFAQTVT